MKKLRTATDLSQHDLSTLIQISKRSIAKIELGNENLSVSKVNILLDFFNLSADDLSDGNLSIDHDLRDTLAAHHKTAHPEYTKSLTKKPGIVYAIDYKLLPSKFLTEPKQIHDIKEYFASLGWDFKSSSLTNALQRKPKQIRWEKLGSVKDINLYSEITI
ncbi:MAG: helix-turn-helix domain-containing protein [Bacteroidota bacterium]|nr:helix-turn-helix domain-containing protein [Bacteroidota bacterium]